MTDKKKKESAVQSRFKNTKTEFTELAAAPTIKEKAKKSLRTVNVNKEVITEYMDMAFNYFKSIGQIGVYSTSSFLCVAIEMVEELYIKKYGELLEPSESDKKFFAKRGPADRDTLSRYNHTDIKPIMFTITSDYYERYIQLMNTFYKNELSNLRSYGNSFYFYDFFSQVKEIVNDKR
ncbi:hypothetical protein NWE55_16600 (plasmid) [Myroides albus]|uniref:hypothetical protein n=1 Tax=Myroides TaxID=76831 RepID=UPI002159A445|nr:MULTISPECIES: hypothetical protein [Myroides]UVD81363.1 hypothetical protein NWE55_16960 [Myroides albus]UVD81381.1 hypothetical protein NWE55_16600 [Myroides albus]